jgi:1-phosphofructokinase
VIVTLTLNPSLDRTFSVPALDRGEVTRATSARLDPAGKGVNVARALLANGVDALAVLPVGGMAGAHLTHLLVAEGVRFEQIAVAGETRSNVSLVEPDGTVTKINEPGRALEATALTDLARVALELSEPNGWIVVSGSLPAGNDAGMYAELVGQFRAAGRRVALDTSGPPFVRALGAGPTLVKPNRAELAEAVGRPVISIADAVAAARELIARGAGAVVASLADDGALHVDAASVVHAHAAVDAVLSPVGAGDCLLAGFLAHDGSPSERLGVAVRWAAAAVETAGSGAPTRERIAMKQPIIDVDPDFASVLDRR